MVCFNNDMCLYSHNILMSLCTTHLFLSMWLTVHTDPQKVYCGEICKAFDSVKFEDDMK